jgi:retinol dehydrogenase-12
MPFTPSSDIPDLSGKVIIVTGGNNGIGKETVKQLAQHSPAKVYLAARTQAKYNDAVKAIKEEGDSTDNIAFLPLDLASLQSVSNAAKQVLAENERLDIVINNAGIMGALPGLTEDGFEVHFGTNHMGHAYLVRMLMPLLSKTAALPNSDVRVVNVSSKAEAMVGKSFDLESEKTELAGNHSYVRYARSKLANVLFTRSMAKHYPSIKTTVVHPGRVRTTLLDDMFSRGISLTSVFQSCYDFFAMVGLEEGAKNQLWAAVSPQAENGMYYDPIAKKGGESKLSKSAEFAQKLWDWQENEFKAFEVQKKVL